MTHVLDAWHLPLLGDGEIVDWDERPLAGRRYTVRTPRLRPGTLTRYAARLREARRQALVGRPARDIARVLAAAGESVANGATRELILEALPAATGFSGPMAAHILDGMAADWTIAALHALLDAELGGGTLLDGFVPDGQRRVRAVGAPLTLHVFAGNVPGVPVTSLIRATLVKSASLAKTARDEPLLAPLFARAVHARDPDLGACLAVTWWPGGEQEIEEEAFAAAELAVVYGGGSTIAAIRQRAPAHLTLVEHGPKISFGAVARAAMQDEAVARATAREVAAAATSFDQHGCVSPQTVYVERGAGVTPVDFAALVAEAFDEAADALPRGALSHRAAVSLRELAASAEFRATSGADVRLFEARDALVIYDGESAAFEGSCLDRSLRVKAVERVEDVPRLVAPFRDVLQSAALAGLEGSRRAALADALAAAGVTRITSFARLPWPGATWHHDGRGPLTELVRFVDLED